MLTQIGAVTSALNTVALKLLDDHLKHCVAPPARTDDAQAQAKLEEAAAAIARLVTS